MVQKENFSKRQHQPLLNIENNKNTSDSTDAAFLNFSVFL